MNFSDPQFKDKAVGLLSIYLGPNNALLYKKFYGDKNNKVVFASLNELLTDYLGQEKAKQEIERIYG